MLEIFKTQETVGFRVGEKVKRAAPDLINPLGNIRNA